ncbi:UV-damage endonuclease [Drechslerella dactyloides]|uniref:UV-damage endonuclease n=1 Tax=Drechslerella dactyloides TaxID=74499 RepID=A0AAD6J8J7_DREDA|nr:UV-damage endonuclease [Drechslerella dactyloides]
MPRRRGVGEKASLATSTNGVTAESVTTLRRSIRTVSVAQTTNYAEQEDEPVKPKRKVKKSPDGRKRPREDVENAEEAPALTKAKKPAGKKRKPSEEASDFEPLELEADEIPTERPPAVNDDYRPVPFKGRLGFACLNTYLRNCNPPVFCSRTCRLDTILKHDAESGAGAGMAYLKSLGVTNATDLSTLIRWNHKYNIKFLRISSEMFPFASHAVHGYTLEHAAEPLKRAGQLAMQYGHRLTMHPGQFTQLGSPRSEVVENAIRDLQHHCELLDRLQLQGQYDRDAVMIIHMGGVFGDKKATIARFEEVYTTRLSDGIKRRLVLENDDVSWSVEELLPTCQKLSIPLVLDWHHNNIIPGTLREGTYDVKKVYGEAIRKTWTDKGITQKQHYSEPKPGSITGMQRRRHSARVVDLPPCDDTMDLMIEAKDKEQAVFELMRSFKLDGWENIGDVVPHERRDENPVETKTRKKKKEEENEEPVALIPAEEVGMGGSENRVYWPEGLEEYLRPKKKVRAKKEQPEEEDAIENGAATPKPSKKRSKKASVTVVTEDIVTVNGDATESISPPPKRGRKAANSTVKPVKDASPAKRTRKKKTD